MSKNAKRLIGRMSNNLRALLHTRLDRMQRRLLSDVRETLDLLEVEVKSESETLTTEEN